MRRTGPRSSTDAPARPRSTGRRPAAPAGVAFACVLAVLLCAGAASALDVFTLWQRPEAPLRIAPGDRVDYLATSLEAGRRRVELLRIQCVGESEDAWLIEVLPLDETDAGRAPRPGEGVRLTVARALAARAGDLVDHIRRVEQWEGGERHELPPEQWRDDPLAGDVFATGFVPDEVETQGRTTRVVGEADLLCDQFTLTAVDTTRITLPRGEMLQLHTREVSAAIHAAVPFLGLAYAAERAETRSELVPAGRRSPPPPSMKVEIMELLEFGEDASPVLGGLE